jgi:hypothetical protein
MRAYLTRRMLALAAVALAVAAVGGYCIYLTPPGSRWVAILALVAGVGVGGTLVVYPRHRSDPPGRER